MAKFNIYSDREARCKYLVERNYPLLEEGLPWDSDDIWLRDQGFINNSLIQMIDSYEK